MKACDRSLTTSSFHWANSPDSVPASKCLAFLGNIDGQFWNEFVYDNPLTHLKFILYTIYSIPRKVMTLMKTKMTQIRRQSYIGYDKRDKKDYNMEGYDDEEEAMEQFNQEKQQREHCTMTYLLLLSQMLINPIDIVTACIENDRDRYGVQQLVQLHKPLKAIVAIEETGEEASPARLRQPPPPPPRPSSNGVKQPRVKVATTAWDASKMDFVDMLDSPEQEDYQQNSVARHLLLVSDEVLELINVKGITEDSFHYAIKALIGINNQFPKQSNGTKHTEVVDLFVLADTEREDCGALTQVSALSSHLYCLF